MGYHAKKIWNQNSIYSHGKILLNKRLSVQEILNCLLMLLVLVDGMEMSLNNVNPNDIASISILKDAASCAIYGNRGANGVILLTTKKGTDGKINVTYSGKFSYNTPANLIRMVSNYADYMEFINEASDNAGQAQVFSQTTIDTWRAAASNPNGISESGYPNYVAYPNTDWYDEVYNPKLMQEHSITLTGAEKRTRYSLNATYVDNPGLVVNSGMKKYYMRSNLESQVASFLAVGLNAWGYHVDQERNNVDDLKIGEKWVCLIYHLKSGIYRLSIQ